MQKVREELPKDFGNESVETLLKKYNVSRRMFYLIKAENKKKIQEQKEKSDMN